MGDEEHDIVDVDTVIADIASCYPGLKALNLSSNGQWPCIDERCVFFHDDLFAMRPHA